MACGGGGLKRCRAEAPFLHDSFHSAHPHAHQTHTLCPKKEEEGKEKNTRTLCTPPFDPTASKSEEAPRVLVGRHVRPRPRLQHKRVGRLAKRGPQRGPQVLGAGQVEGVKIGRPFFTVAHRRDCPRPPVRLPRRGPRGGRPLGRMLVRPARGAVGGADGGGNGFNSREREALAGSRPCRRSVHQHRVRHRARGPEGRVGCRVGQWAGGRGWADGNGDCHSSC